MSPLPPPPVRDASARSVPLEGLSVLEGALVDDAVKRLADLLNHVTAEALRRAVALLRQVEWVKQYHEGEWVHRCPVCGAVREDRGDHTAWCDLAAFVSAYPEWKS